MTSKIKVDNIENQCGGAVVSNNKVRNFNTI